MATSIGSVDEPSSAVSAVPTLVTVPSIVSPEA
jgi:hypothetical protein